MDKMTIATSELRAAFETMIAGVEARTRGSVTFESDYYWSSMHLPAIHNPYGDPSERSLGRISDDIHDNRALTALEVVNVVLPEVHHLAGRVLAVAAGQFVGADPAERTFHHEGGRR
jgi:hypothetical protein